VFCTARARRRPCPRWAFSRILSRTCFFTGISVLQEFFFHPVFLSARRQLTTPETRREKLVFGCVRTRFLPLAPPKIPYCLGHCLRGRAPTAFSYNGHRKSAYLIHYTHMHAHTHMYMPLLNPRIVRLFRLSPL